MLKAILVDDEPGPLEELSWILTEIGGVQVAGMYQDPVKALEGIKETQPEAVFLDIEMGVIDGFTLADEILRLPRPCAIVFATAYNEYAVKAFEINAVDYVLKPFTKERLGLTIRKLFKQYGETLKKPPESLGAFVREQKLKQSVKKVPVWKDDSFLLLNPHEIFYFTVADGGVWAATGQGRYSSREPLNYWEERLKDQRFFRTHKSFLVNLDKVRQAIPFFNYTYLLKFDGLKEEVPVSRSYLKDFKRLMLL
ncbi:MAG: LytTR family DNA-binding domain-containing protein [Firmicutes bacterium]|nr:LytTR family DNA-binding domain-containing protein [Bacillota bacterium]